MAELLTAEQQAVKDQALADAGRIYAEAIARQDARPAREAAREALGKRATDAEVAAWIGEFRSGRG